MLTDLSPAIDRAVALLAAKPGPRQVTIRDGAKRVYVVASGPQSSSLLITGEAGKGLRPFRYLYRARAGRMEAFDLDLKERLSRKLLAPGLDGIAKSIGPVEDPVRASADPVFLRTLLAPFRGKQAWSGTNPYRLKVKDAAYTLRFGGDGEVSDVKFERGGRVLSWNVRPTNGVALGPVENYRVVDRFVRRPMLPTGDQAARAALDTTLLAWRRLTNASVVRSDGPTLLFSFDRTGERDGGTGWDYRNGILTVVANGKGWRGPVGAGKIAGYVATYAKIRADRFALARALGTFPLAEVIPASGRVRRVGVTADGSILEVTGAGVVSSFVTDEKNRTTSFESRPVNVTGIAGSRVNFRYGPPVAPLTAPRYLPFEAF